MRNPKERYKKILESNKRSSEKRSFAENLIFSSLIITVATSQHSRREKQNFVCFPSTLNIFLYITTDEFARAESPR